MLGLVQNEFIKMSHSKKLYFALLLIVGLQIIAVLQYVFMPDKPELNGASFAFTIIDFLPYIFVLFISVFVAEQWTEENSTLKLSLTRPINRTTLLNAKLLSFFVLVTFLALFTFVSACAVGTVAFGWGGQIIWNGSVVGQSSSIGVYIEVMIGILLPTLGFGFLVTFIALLTENSGIAIGVSLGIALVSQVLEQIETINIYSIVYHMRTFYQSILQSAEFGTTWKSLVVIAAYTILFYLLSCLYFRKKDITT